MNQNNELLTTCLKSPISLAIGAFLLFKYAKHIDAKIASELIDVGGKLIKSTKGN